MVEWKRYPQHVPKAKEWYLVHGEHMGETFVECDYYDNDLWQYRQLDVTYWADLNLPQGIEPHWPSQDTDAEKLLEEYDHLMFDDAPDWVTGCFFSLTSLDWWWSERKPDYDETGEGTLYGRIHRMGRDYNEKTISQDNPIKMIYIWRPRYRDDPMETLNENQ